VINQKDYGGVQGLKRGERGITPQKHRAEGVRRYPYRSLAPKELLIFNKTQKWSKANGMSSPSLGLFTKWEFFASQVGTVGTWTYILGHCFIFCRLVSGHIAY
jgi:hypothetical protein